MKNATRYDPRRETDVPDLLRVMGWVAVTIFAVEALFVVVGPYVSDAVRGEFEETGKETVLVSQGAALLVIAAGVLVASTVFAAPDPSPAQPRQSGATDGPTPSGSPTGERVRLLAVSSAGQESPLVVESVGGDQIRLMVVTENPVTAALQSGTSDQEESDWGRQRLADVSRWLVASVGFAGALFVLVDENPVLAVLILGPQIYGLAVAYIVVGAWTLWQSLPILIRPRSTA